MDDDFTAADEGQTVSARESSRLRAREAWALRTFGPGCVQTISALPGQLCRSFFGSSTEGIRKAHEWRMRRYGTP